MTAPMSASPPAVPRLVPSALRLANRTAGTRPTRFLARFLSWSGPARWP